MKNYLKFLIIPLLLFVSACEPSHMVYVGSALDSYFTAVEQRSLKSGKIVSFQGDEQILRTRFDTLHVYRNDSTIVFLPDYKVNYDMGDEKNGILILEADTPTGLKSIRMAMGRNYRKHAEVTPLILGQVVNGKYDARLDTVQTIYELLEGQWPK